MATIITAYDHLWRLTKTGGLNLETAQIRLRMVTSGYLFNVGHELWDNGLSNSTNPSHHEVSPGDGYVAGGKLLENPDVSNTRITYDDVVWESLTKTFRGLVGVAIGEYDGITDPLLFYLLPDSTPADIVSNGSNYSVIWNVTNGVFYRPAL